jgi:hypothetical protein
MPVCEHEAARSRPTELFSAFVVAIGISTRTAFWMAGLEKAGATCRCRSPISPTSSENLVFWPKILELPAGRP